MKDNIDSPPNKMSITVEFSSVYLVVCKRSKIFYINDLTIKSLRSV